jgi:hypothetical protein
MIVITAARSRECGTKGYIQAGKDVYQEKTMAFNPDHAKRMRKAFQGSGRVVQIGMQSDGDRLLPEGTPDALGYPERGDRMIGECNQRRACSGAGSRRRTNAPIPGRR